MTKLKRGSPFLLLINFDNNKNDAKTSTVESRYYP